VKIYFKAPYYFIHGTNDPDSMGEAASHGCIRMVPDDAVALARRIQEAGGSVPLLIKD
jgi:L,D-transpeptidase ErfK/SrfK